MINQLTDSLKLHGIDVTGGRRSTRYATADDWLMARRSLIGASESAAILGEGYEGESPWTVWDRKVNGLDDPCEREELECGDVLQPGILELFRRRTGFELFDPGRFTIWHHPDLHFMGATLDGAVACPFQVVEAKNVSVFQGTDWKGEEPPLKFNIQVQHQMAVTGAEAAYVVGLIGGNRLIYKRVERDNRFIGALIGELAKFWSYVERQVPPPVDGLAGTAKVLARMHPNDNGETVELPIEAADWDRELAEAKAAIKEAEKKKLLAENRLRAALGDNTFGVLPDGGRYSFKTQDRPECVSRATSFRVLRRLKK